jgi:hypothetical protein
MEKNEIKSINITGGAVADYTGGSKKEKRSRTKKNQQGGSEITKDITSNGLSVQSNPSTQSYAASAASPNPNTWLKYPVNSPVPPTIQPQIRNISVSTPPPQALNPPSQTGGNTKQIRVELKKKTATKKVHLQPKKVEAPKTTSLKKHQTKKSRKVTLGVSSLHKRMIRAKKMTKKAKDMPIEKLKEHLIKHKLIKHTSKAPESVLRQIAADSQIVAGKAL